MNEHWFLVLLGQICHIFLKVVLSIVVVHIHFGLQFCYKKTIFQIQLYIYCLVVHVFCFDNVLLTYSLKFCDIFKQLIFTFCSNEDSFLCQDTLEDNFFCLLWMQMLLSNYYSHFCIPYLPVSYKIWTYFQYIDNTEEIVLIHIKQQDLMPFCVPLRCL